MSVLTVAVTRRPGLRILEDQVTQLFNIKNLNPYL